jgi:hypothetical protein
MAEQGERPVGVALVHPVETVVGDQVGDVAAALDDRVTAPVVTGLLHHGVVVVTPSRQHPPAVESWLYVPVRTAARLGVQIEFVQKHESNLMPSVAMRSRLGVWLTTGRTDAAL